MNPNCFEVYLLIILSLFGTFKHYFLCRLHTGGRRPGHGQAVRQRLLADHHLPLRGLEPLLQEHVQAQTPAGAMAQRRRQQPP